MLAFWINWMKFWIKYNKCGGAKMGQRRLRTGFEAYSALCQCETRGRDSMEYETTKANVFWNLSLYYSHTSEKFRRGHSML